MKAADKINVLFAEDEASLGMIVKESLETRDFVVDHVTDGQSALDSFDRKAHHIAVLDVMMPKLDGFSVASKIREKNKSIPIIFLTSRSRTEDLLEGYERGGNDYLKKPFSMEELIVRIKELLKRSERKTSQEEISIGNYQFNTTKQTLTINRTTTELTHKEAHLLKMLCDNINEVVERRHLLNEIWGSDDFFNGRSMDVFITKLRKKLNADDNIQILNIRGKGYKLVV